MSDKVVKLQPVEVGDGYRLNPDEVLEAAKGQPFVTLAIIGMLEDGSLWVSGNANEGQVLILLKQAEHFICFGQ